MTNLTVKEVALKEQLSVRRIRAKITQGHHYPHAKMCECGQAWLIPEKDIHVKGFAKDKSFCYK